MKVAVIDDYQNIFSKLNCFAQLKGQEVTVFQRPAKDEVELAEQLRDAEAVILTMQRTAITRSLLDKLPKLRMISQTSRTISHIDVAACTQKGVVISVGDPGSLVVTAELAWALILAAQRHIPDEVQALKSGRWQTTVGIALSGKTLGIYAYGKLGSMMAPIGRAFGMRVICWGRDGSLAKAREAGFEAAASRKEFFSTVDVLTLHLPLNKETRGIVTAEDLASMKSDALLVNTSRAGIIAEGALLAALKQGRPGRAAVDVYDHEPVLDGNNPLLKLDNVLCTPHLGYVEKGKYEVMYTAAIEQLLSFAAGTPINVANPEVLKAA
ncbi:MAG TPA: D-2-hydroxyacid dehydrogenase family protein [Xanthobacteraceae bacterium]|jgi:D-3-phosphoglycerate dehydrogenase|nr:D-2-hydroxyacid dehydrogenase family protein [Xanthobacteraceae bacterium]